MKRIATFCLILTFTLGMQAQTLDGYPLSDHLVSATHTIPCLEDDYVLNWPNDSIWVNRVVGDTMIAYFNDGWFNHSGFDLLLETGFHPSNYDLRLILDDGSFSTTHTVVLADWSILPSIDWVYSITDCSSGSGIIAEQNTLALDFVTDFGLGGGDEVVGIELVFLSSPGTPDIAGIYIIAPPCEATSSQLSVEACASYTSPSGNFVWDTTGNYVDTLLNAEGCDSILFIALIILDTLDAEIALLTGNTLTALNDSATYQWVNCPDFTLIPGATNQDYVATSIGAYAVIVSKSDCIDTSACFDVLQVGLRQEKINEFSIYPNPINTEFILHYKDVQGPELIILQNLAGAVISSYPGNTSGQSYMIPNELPSGIYLIKLEFNGYSLVKKLVLLR